MPSRLESDEGGRQGADRTLGLARRDALAGPRREEVQALWEVTLSRLNARRDGSGPFTARGNSIWQTKCGLRW